MPQAQGAWGQTLVQRETTFKTLPSTIASKKVYFTKNTLKFMQPIEKSKMIRGGSRHPTQGFRGETDVAGDINTELNANTMLFFAALGSIESSMTGGTFGSALTTPTAVIDAVNCVMTVTSTTHGLVPGDSTQIAGITAPTSLNDKIFAVFDAPTANTFKVAIPVGTTTTFTLGSGTIKKVTAAGTILVHTLKAGGGIPFYTIERGSPDISQYFKYSGCGCNKLSFGIPSAGLIELLTTWMGGAEAYATSSFETGTAIDNYSRIFDGLSIAAADTKEGGSATTIFKKVNSIEIDNMLDGDTFVVGGAGARGSINAGVYQISASIDVLFTDTTLYAKAKNQTETSLDFTLKRGTGDGTTGNESLQIVLPEGTFMATGAPVIETDKGIVSTYEFSGYYDNHADATGLKMIIKNSILPGQLI